MIRTQIQLTDEQYSQLKELALQNHQSMAEVIRLAVDKLLLSQEPDRSSLYRQAEAVIGKYTAGADDVAVGHDRYLNDAFSA
ncbi:MAG: ribbon-helix-helix protein, CopG family [Gammaproteobacteria bacterium]